MTETERDSFVVLLICLIIVTILCSVASYPRYYTRTQEITSTIEKSIPKGWAIMEVKENTVPPQLNGTSECVYVRIENLSSTEHPIGKRLTLVNTTHPYIEFWFAPPNWDEIYQWTPYGQFWTYTIIQTSKYKIYYFYYSENITEILINIENEFNRL